MKICTPTPTRAFVATTALTVVLLAGACGGNNDASSADQDSEFNQRLSAENLDVEVDFARQQAQNTCTDLDESTDDPANVDPFELYNITQRIAVRTDLPEDDAATIAALGIDIYCPEYKASWER
ncbi:DUF732 domain-containing protein (plasmid) [Rhodococcus aetherivorans]|uniref:DUF732 domain-containing protein n=1 Tax=Rhodococcus aetherivorans TaxID=191292 RepID=A0AA46Q033_9NOCA|nr:DUF732 domain-containing protein [Rhodococcus aetherivorans]MDV6297432.1 DUF732 domain-containing protein [Rhodococcus aetherivorans]UYF97211.1 DUF732 domain-containing protein [Rhodococcus aetherivorans]